MPTPVHRGWRRFEAWLNKWGTLIALAFLLAAVFVNSYSGRVDIHNAVLHGCARGDIDKVQTMERDADHAEFLRLAVIRAKRNGDMDIATKYEVLRHRALRRTLREAPLVVDCTHAFPSPSLIELGSSLDSSVAPIPKPTFLPAEQKELDKQAQQDGVPAP